MFSHYCRTDLQSDQDKQLKILVILHVRHVCLFRRDVLRIEQWLPAGRPDILCAEAEFALPRKTNTDAEVHTCPALHPVIGRTWQSGFEHAPHDGSADAPVFDAEAQRGLVQIIRDRSARARQEVHAALAGAEIQLGAWQY